MKKPALYITLSALLVVLAGAAAYFLCNNSGSDNSSMSSSSGNAGSVEQPIAFHESWSPEQRADLTEMLTLMRDALQDKPAADQADSPEAQKVQHIYEMLRRVAESGRGDIYTEEGFSAAHLASFMSMPELQRELVLRGANPNATQIINREDRESVFHSAICCAPITEDTERLSQAERLEQLEWLLEHGADVTLDSDMALVLAYMADRMDQWHQDESSIPGATTEWLLEHGLKPQGERGRKMLIMHICLRGSLPCVQRLVEKGYIDRMDKDALNEMLGLVVKNADSDAAAKARWLLSLGADTDAALRSCSANIQLYGNSENEGDNESYNYSLQVLDALLDYGAELTDPAHVCPDAEPQKSAFLELLDKHAPAQENE